ncbi:MAG: glycosyltransferase [Gemmatimonadota bacterium]
MTLVSVILPVYNTEAFITEAIDSVLTQGPEPLELIIVDDGSTDATPDIVAGYGSTAIKYARQENRGAAAAMNAAVRLISGEWVAFQNADDVWLPGRLPLQRALLDAHPEADIIIGHMKRMWRPAGEVEWKCTEKEFAMSLQSCLVRRTVLDRIGSFDETLRCCFDWDWLFRARETGVSFLTHPEITHYYRRHETNISGEATANPEVAIIIKRSLERRRAKGMQGSLASLNPNTA